MPSYIFNGYYNLGSKNGQGSETIVEITSFSSINRIFIKLGLGVIY